MSTSNKLVEQFHKDALNKTIDQLVELKHSDIDKRLKPYTYKEHVKALGAIGIHITQDALTH